MKLRLAVAFFVGLAGVAFAPADAKAHPWRRGCFGYRSYGFYGYSGSGYNRCYYSGYGSPSYGYYGYSSPNYGYSGYASPGCSYSRYGSPGYSYSGYGTPSYGYYGGYPGVGGAYGGYSNGVLGGDQMLNLLGGTLGQASYVSIPVGLGYGPPGYLQVPVGGVAGRATFMQVPISAGFGPTTYLQIQVGAGGANATPADATPTPANVAPSFGFTPNAETPEFNRVTMGAAASIDLEIPPVASPAPASRASESLALKGLASKGETNKKPSKSPFRFAVSKSERDEPSTIGGNDASPRIDTDLAPIDFGPSLGAAIEPTISRDDAVPWVVAP